MQARSRRNGSAVAFARYRMRRMLARVLSEDHQWIDKRSCKRRGSNQRQKYQKFSPRWAAVLFDSVLGIGRAAYCRSRWEVLSSVSSYYGNRAGKFPSRLSLRNRCVHADFGVAVAHSRIKLSVALCIRYWMQAGWTGCRQWALRPARHCHRIKMRMSWFFGSQDRADLCPTRLMKSRPYPRIAFTAPLSG